MIMINKILNLLIFTPLFFGLSGCATTMNDGTRTTAEGAIGGTLIGAVACAFLKNKSLCAPIIAVTTLTGGGVGYYIAQRKQQYASEEAFLAAEIQRTQQFNQIAVQQNQQTQQELVSLEQQLDKLSLKKRNSRSTKLALAKKHSKISSMIDKNNGVLKNLQDEYADKSAYIQQNRQQLASGNKLVQSLNTETEILSRNIQQLKDSNEQLAKMNNRASM